MLTERPYAIVERSVNLYCHMIYYNSLVPLAGKYNCFCVTQLLNIQCITACIVHSTGTHEERGLKARGKTLHGEHALRSTRPCEKHGMVNMLGVRLRTPDML